MKTRARLPRLVATGATLALALSLSACGDGNGGASSDDGKIHVLVYGDASNKVEQQIVDTFNKTSDVKVVLDTIPGADYQKKLQTIISTPQAPDVFFNWGGGSIKPFVKADLLLPLDDFIKKNPDLKDKFLPSVFDSAVVDGKPYGIPMRGTQPVLLFHNKKVLAEAASSRRRPGTNCSPRWTSSRTRASRRSRSAAATSAHPDVVPVPLRPHSRSGAVRQGRRGRQERLGEPGEQEGPGHDQGAGRLRRFGKNYDSVKYTNGGSVQLVASGKAGFELMGSWYYSQQLTDHPDFAEKDLGYTAFPSVEGGKGDPANVAGNTNNYYSVMKKTKHPRPSPSS